MPAACVYGAFRQPTFSDLPITAAVVEGRARQLASKSSLCDVDVIDAPAASTPGLGGLSEEDAPWRPCQRALVSEHGGSSSLRRAASASASASSHGGPPADRWIYSHGQKHKTQTRSSAVRRLRHRHSGAGVFTLAP